MSAQLKTPKTSQAATRKKLLETAAEAFALRGFTSTTVREICEKAGANIAAVNYHFGDKDRLYAEVLRHALHAAHEKHPPTLGLSPAATPEKRLRAFIESLLRRLFDEGRHSWHARLMAREMVEPTRALDALVKEEIRPLSDTLQGIIRELLGRSATQEHVRLCGLSVVGQCLFHHHCRPVLARLHPKMQPGPQAVQALAGHITRFSLAALAAARTTSTETIKPRRRR